MFRRLVIRPVETDLSNLAVASVAVFLAGLRAEHIRVFPGAVAAERSEINAVPDASAATHIIPMSAFYRSGETGLGPVDRPAQEQVGRGVSA